MANFEVEKPFLPVYIDAVLSLKAASETEDNEIRRILVKSAIIHCSFAVEALANNAIQFLNFSKHLSNSIDKLDPIAKLELFSLQIRKKEFERGDKAFQVLSALISVRNSYVHPKIRRRTVSLPDGEEINELQEFCLDENSDTTNDILRLSRNPESWRYEDALRCIRLLTESFDYILIRVVELEKNSLMCMFYNHLTINDISGIVIPENDKWLNWLSEKENVVPDFYMNHIKVRADKLRF
ncbi:hypothetical protein D515_01977 [Grimontia indica]|uniref:Uncharacterized protein n=1 Tax=Grimontia indica TaxID=1056512 RepID=R1GSY7_9GAMM|nr:hypothetical protein [Grimontia indica]EOD79313.1 hypothetical protein D515_01977 [Grimontia indica]